MMHQISTVASAIILFATSAHGLEPFTIAVIPDTQSQALHPTWSRSSFDTTSWLRQNAAANNIAFVTHVGDVVQGDVPLLSTFFPALGWEAQWNRMNVVMAELDNANILDGTVLPYSVSLGNHDLLPRNDKTSPNDTISGGAFRSFFGQSRYAPYQMGGMNSFQWYGGADQTEWNHFQLFNGGGNQFLHINLEFEPENLGNDLGLNRIAGVDDAIGFAQAAIDAHPGVPTIVTSHKLLTDLDNGPDRITQYAGDGIDQSFGAERTSTGQFVFDQLVSRNPQIFMTINGHEHEGPYREDGEGVQISENEAGLPVIEILANYQDYLNPLTGSDPYIRLITFDPDTGEIRNSTFSPTFQMFLDNPDNVESFVNDLLNEFEGGLPVPVTQGEEIVGLLSPFPLLPGDTPATPEDVLDYLFDFFGVADLDGLKQAEFSSFLTDPDSAFTISASFDGSGRILSAEFATAIPIPAAAWLFPAGLIAGIGWMRRRRI